MNYADLPPIHLRKSAIVLCSFIPVYRKPADPRVTRERATSHDPNRRYYCVARATPINITEGVRSKGLLIQLN